jgi:hypothetical protein
MVSKGLKFLKWLDRDQSIGANPTGEGGKAGWLRSRSAMISG